MLLLLCCRKKGDPDSHSLEGKSSLSSSCGFRPRRGRQARTYSQKSMRALQPRLRPRSAVASLVAFLKAAAQELSNVEVV